MLQDYCWLHKKAKGATVFAIKMILKYPVISKTRKPGTFS
jgi:hypothetical protein